MNYIIKLFKKYFTDKYTIAGDKYPFWYPGNDREMLIRTRGLLWARDVAKSWVRRYANGQARILEGWHYWEEKENETRTL